jgi:hypothetical protein
LDHYSPESFTCINTKTLTKKITSGKEAIPNSSMLTKEIKKSLIMKIDDAECPTAVLN